MEIHNKVSVFLNNYKIKFSQSEKKKESWDINL